MVDIIIRFFYFDVNDLDFLYFYQCKYFKNKYLMICLSELK